VLASGAGSCPTLALKQACEKIDICTTYII
jgi:hypothetical protein